MFPDVTGRITSNKLLHLLNSISEEKRVPITVHRVRHEVDSVPANGRFNIFVLTHDNSVIPPDASQVESGVYYKKNGHIFITKDIDEMFLTAPDALSDIAFSPIADMIDEVPSCASGSLEAFGESVITGASALLHDVGVLKSEWMALEEARETALADTRRSLAAALDDELNVERSLRRAQNADWASQQGFLQKLIPTSYMWYEMDGDAFRGITNDIALNHRDIMGHELDVPLGQFSISLSPHREGLGVSASPHSNNTHRENYYHPHVDHNGTICMGDMSGAFEEATEHYDIIAIFSLVHQVLSTYCPEEPYIQLEAWR